MKRPLAYNYEPIHILRDWTPRGVIHVGANDGEEFVFYKAMGVKNLVGFEPLATPFDKFQENHPDVLKFRVGWAEHTDVLEINVTENDKASSVLPVVHTDDWTTHPVFKDWNMGQWPIIGQETITVVRYESFADGRPYDPADYNFLNMDIQGMELEALKGMGAQLDWFDALVIECSKEPVYIGEAPAAEVAAYLESQGFEQVTRTMLHGDVLFLRKDQIDG